MHIFFYGDAICAKYYIFRWQNVESAEFTAIRIRFLFIRIVQFRLYRLKSNTSCFYTKSNLTAKRPDDF